MEGILNDFAPIQFGELPSRKVLRDPTYSCVLKYEYSDFEFEMDGRCISLGALGSYEKYIIETKTFDLIIDGKLFFQSYNGILKKLKVCVIVDYCTILYKEKTYQLTDFL